MSDNSKKAITKTALAVLKSINWNRRNPEWKHIGNPIKNATAHVTTITKTLLVLNWGNSSMMEPIRASQPPQTEDMANKTNIKKNKNENNGPGFITAIASGYAYENMLSFLKNSIDVSQL